MYNWPNVAQRTAAVYDRLAAMPVVSNPQQELLGRLRRYRCVSDEIQPAHYTGHDVVWA